MTRRTNSKFRSIGNRHADLNETARKPGGILNSVEVVPGHRLLVIDRDPTVPYMQSIHPTHLPVKYLLNIENTSRSLRSNGRAQEITTL